MFAFLKSFQAAINAKQRAVELNYFKSIRYPIFIILLTVLVIYKILYFNYSTVTLAKKQKYLTSTFEHPADLGNMLFRFASLYGIGKKLERIPYVNGHIKAQLNGLTEISEYFPSLHEIIEIKVPDPSLVTEENFTDECCVYESPKVLKKYESVKYLKVSANYLQSYKFFNDYKHEIMELMECSGSFKTKSEYVAKALWGKEKEVGHKMCVHVRRGDFVENWPLETRMDFALPAIEYIYKNLKKQSAKKISLLLLGNDEVFINGFNHSINPNIKSVKNLFSFNTSRSFDMCFGIRYCDSLLITASASTYAWWIGYLMKSQGPVYYNAVITKIGIHAKDAFDYDLFPPHWHKLMLYNNDTIKPEYQWTLQRRKLNPTI